MILAKTLQCEVDWAHKTLDTEVSELKDILKYLQKEDFSLENEAYEAVCIINDLKCNQDSLRYTILRELRQNVENFASEFFILSVDEREHTLNNLWEQSKSYPELIPRLMELRGGLKVEPWKAESNLAKDIILDLFILPNNKRDRKFIQIQKYTPGRKNKILKDYKNLNAIHPDIAQLIPYFSEKITEKKAPVNKSFSRPVNEKNQNESSFSWAAGLLIFFAVKLLIIIGANSSSSSSQPSNTYQNNGPYYQDYRNIKNDNIEENIRRYRQVRPQNSPANPPRPGYRPPSQPGYTPPSQPGFPSNSPSFPSFP